MMSTMCVAWRQGACQPPTSRTLCPGTRWSSASLERNASIIGGRTHWNPRRSLPHELVLAGRIRLSELGDLAVVQHELEHHVGELLDPETIRPPRNQVLK